MLSLIASAPALADGIAFKGRDWTALIPARENEQIAAIHHQGGVQRMIIAVNFDAEEDEQGLWIFPVLGTPESTFVDIQDQYPRFAGYDPRQRARDRISTLMMATRAWEIFPLLLEGMFLPTLRYGGGLSVHQEVERFGVRAEVVTASSVESLAEHLHESGTGVGVADLATLASYLDGQYVLIVAWIRSIEELKESFPGLEGRRLGSGRTPTLYVEFATDKPFYPLKPTSRYGDLEIPLRLHVIGFVEPRTAAHITRRLNVSHYRLEKPLGDELGSFVEGLDSWDLHYTVVRGRVPAERFTDDLTFVPVRPAKMNYAEGVQAVLGLRSVFLVLVALLIGVSYVSGGVAGLLVARRWATPAWLGCWNVLTIVGLSFALRYHNLTGDSGATEKQLRRRYLLAFFAAYVIISVAMQVALSTPLRW